MATAQRSKVTPEASQPLTIPLVHWRDEDGAPLTPGTPSAGDFAIVLGGWGAGTAVLEGEAANNNTKTSTMTTTWAVPQNFEKSTYTGAAKALSLVIPARVSVGAATSATLDVQVYKSDADGTVGSDLYTGAALDINSTSWANQTFSLVATNLEPGDELIVIVRAIVNDAGGTADAKAQIGQTKMVATTRM